MSEIDVPQSILSAFLRDRALAMIVDAVAGREGALDKLVAIIHASEKPILWDFADAHEMTNEDIGALVKSLSDAGVRAYAVDDRKVISTGKAWLAALDREARKPLGYVPRFGT